MAVCGLVGNAPGISSSATMHRSDRCFTSLPVFGAGIFFLNFDHSTASGMASQCDLNLNLI